MRARYSVSCMRKKGTLDSHVGQSLWEQVRREGTDGSQSCDLPIRLIDEINEKLSMGCWRIFQHTLHQCHPASNPRRLLVQTLIAFCQGVSISAGIMIGEGST